MKNPKYLLYLVVVIVILSTLVSLVGLLSDAPSEQTTVTSIYGETIALYGKGIYHNDSKAVAAQGIASDLVTLILGIPLLIASSYYALRGSFRGQLLMTGTLAYFLYTYISYTFLWMYNPLFIVYVILMSASLYAFILMMLSFNLSELPKRYDERLPIKFLGGFQIFIAVAIGLLWLGKIGDAFTSGNPPLGLEHYTTLVIQGMDLGIVVPTAFFSGISLLRKKPIGYLLSSIIIIKGITMLTAITAMILNTLLSGIQVSLVEGILFPGFNLLAIFSLILLMKHVKS